MTTTDTITACPDCGAGTGQPHDDGCDVARCLVTGEQRLMCDRDHEAGDLDCGEDAWTGEWPGEAECREYGWWVRFDAPPPGEQYGQWTPVTEGTAQAVPDLNRLRLECTWDQTARRWVRREQ